MKRILPTIVVVALLLSGCKATHGVIVESHENVRIIEHTELVPVMVKFDIPEVRLERTVRDSSSHLETDFAESDARINPDGSLFHSLNDKAQTLEIPAEVKVEYRDSIVYKETEVPVPVEKELTRWQRFRLDAFWPLLLVLLVGIAYKVTKTIYGKR